MIDKITVNAGARKLGWADQATGGKMGLAWAAATAETLA